MEVWGFGGLWVLGLWGSALRLSKVEHIARFLMLAWLHGRCLDWVEEGRGDVI